MKNKRTVIIEESKKIDLVIQELKTNSEGISLVKTSIAGDYLKGIAEKLETSNAKIKIALL